MASLIRRENAVPRLFESFFGGSPFEAFDRAFGMEPFFRRGEGLLGKFDFRPSFEVKETSDAYVVKADLPGVKEEDVKVTLAGNSLHIEGHREEERKEENKEENYHLSERAYGSFARTFSLPDDANSEKGTAEMKDGVLTVSIGKRPEMTPKSVPVSFAKKEAKEPRELKEGKETKKS